jgi:hypothetical protein
MRQTAITTLNTEIDYLNNAPRSPLRKTWGNRPLATQSPQFAMRGARAKGQPVLLPLVVKWNCGGTMKDQKGRLP